MLCSSGTGDGSSYKRQRRHFLGPWDPLIALERSIWQYHWELSNCVNLLILSELKYSPSKLSVNSAHITSSLVNTMLILQVVCKQVLAHPLLTYAFVQNVLSIYNQFWKVVGSLHSDSLGACTGILSNSVWYYIRSYAHVSCEPEQWSSAVHVLLSDEVTKCELVISSTKLIYLSQDASVVVFVFQINTNICTKLCQTLW